MLFSPIQLDLIRTYFADVLSRCCSHHHYTISSLSSHSEEWLKHHIIELAKYVLTRLSWTRESTIYLHVMSRWSSISFTKIIVIFEHLFFNKLYIIKSCFVIDSLCIQKSTLTSSFRRRRPQKSSDFSNTIITSVFLYSFNGLSKIPHLLI